jgi:hypothetical protein
MSPGKLRQRLGLKGQNVEYERRVVKAHSAPWYKAFARYPVLTEFVKKFSGWDVCSNELSFDQMTLMAKLPTSTMTRSSYVRSGYSTYGLRPT